MALGKHSDIDYLKYFMTCSLKNGDPRTLVINHLEDNNVLKKGYLL